jgi:hypothetical protein
MGMDVTVWYVSTLIVVDEVVRPRAFLEWFFEQRGHGEGMSTSSGAVSGRSREMIP